MTLVYRVEHSEDGHGPYIANGGGSHSEVEGLHGAHGWSKAHPGPYADTELALGLRIESGEGPEYSFGFPNRDAADKWFKGFKRKLSTAGFVINIYESPEDTTVTSASGKQSIFKKNLSKLVDTQSVIRYRY